MCIRDRLKTLQKETGITFVFVTHDQEEALTMSDRIAVINQGSIQQIGNPEEIYEKPSNQFVANFIGEANLILGKCEKTGINGICKLQTGHKISINIPDKYKNTWSFLQKLTTLLKFIKIIVKMKIKKTSDPIRPPFFPFFIFSIFFDGIYYLLSF